jgi:pseudouridine-5'-phosphate glycosidase
MTEPADIAAVLDARIRLGQTGGVLLGVPVPADQELPAAETKRAIGIALEQIRAQGITGKGVTPFLLNAIKEATGSRSLTANIALIRENARVGAAVAVAYAKLAAQPIAQS